MYYEHAPALGSYLILYFFYLIPLPVTIILILLSRRVYIQKRQWMKVVKPLVAWSILWMFISSIAQFYLTHQYLYLYSLTATGTCFTSSCLKESMARDELYKFNITGMEEYGMPNFGIMRAYRVTDSRLVMGIHPHIERVNAVIIARSMFPLPVVEIWDYKVDPRDPHRIIGLERFYIVYPSNPGEVLTEHFDFKFEMFSWGKRYSG
ncbi:hypothetical protein A3L04_04785 [Thermococcus chitonophagus]|uniref:Uncharacterized protein n=1 Tax=Thermococcus chitonophagus TaxID=54262 RepID=A0A161K9M6_9EURY|nr:hypothetical protein A3L04_04785 [Thermococcus chitonophagus]CUX78568.1 hypothetical protein CHITON_1789 [Thermococcus chitonophagus]